MVNQAAMMMKCDLFQQFHIQTPLNASVSMRRSCFHHKVAWCHFKIMMQDYVLHMRHIFQFLAFKRHSKPLPHLNVLRPHGTQQLNLSSLRLACGATPQRDMQWSTTACSWPPLCTSVLQGSAHCTYVVLNISKGESVRVKLLFTSI